jgi:uncharacterized protein YbjT (DUF2867 family)
MRVIVFGATGMVGQGVLREALLDGDVEKVLVVTRTPTGQTHDKLVELLHQDFLDFSSVESQLAGYDACFYCLGISSVGMEEPAYHRITYDMPMAAAQTLARVSPNLTFIYVSGAGTDSSEKGRSMWARVKGKAENALLKLPFKSAYMFRPGIIQPKHGIKSKTRLYRVMYVVFAPLMAILKLVSPGLVTTTEAVGRSMLNAVKSGAPKAVLENRDINSLADRRAS